MAEPTVLVADDEAGVRESVGRALRREGFRVVPAEDGQAALDLLRRGGVDVLLADLRMPGLDGLQLLRAVKLLAPEVEVIVLSGHGTVEEAVQAMKEGAYDFLTKPLERARLVGTVRQALERRALVLENRSLQRRLDELVGAGEIIGESPAIRQLLALVKQVAPPAGNGRSSGSTAPPFPRRFWSRSCSATSAGRLPGRLRGRRDGSSWPTGARFSWMK